MEEQEQNRVPLPSLEQVAQERKKLKHRREYGRILRKTIGTLLVVAAVSVLAATRFLPVLQVSGTSMEPTLKDGEIVILWKTSEYQTGELMGFYYQSKILLKRVIGKPGDYIDIDKDGTVYVNDKRLEETYIEKKSLGECDIELPYQVPDGKVFVMGDHRATSVDSRSEQVGCVAEEQVVGKVVLRIWPLNRVGIIQ